MTTKMSRKEQKAMVSSLLEQLRISDQQLVNMPIIELRNLLRDKSKHLKYKDAKEMEFLLSKERRRCKKLIYAESDKQKFEDHISNLDNELEQLEQCKRSLLYEKTQIFKEIDFYKSFYHH